MFARGMFPNPKLLLSTPCSAEEAEIHWINKPPHGRLSGVLFLDGSGLHPKYPELRRAGWAVVKVDDFGELVAAAYGP
eukprot:4331909-Karenia_brevis.AAC.1